MGYTLFLFEKIKLDFKLKTVMHIDEFLSSDKKSFVCKNS